MDGLPMDFATSDLMLSDGYWWDELATFLFRPNISPRRDVAASGSSRNASAASFDDFQQSVNDAWDLGDDEFCVISGKLYKNENL